MAEFCGLFGSVQEQIAEFCGLLGSVQEQMTREQMAEFSEHSNEP
jgi:hypothetical protein